MIALAQLDAGKTGRRKIHLFDSFEGLPKGSEDHDDEKLKIICGVQKSNSLEPSGALTASMDFSKSLLINKIKYPEEYFVFHKGWFQETIPNAIKKGVVRKISLLRLDGDLYESTKVCLENLWDLVVPGGVVIIDDYGCFSGCKKATNEFFSARNLKPYLHHAYPSSIRYIIKI